MGMSRSMDIVSHQPMPDQGVDVKSTNQLSALGHEMPEQNESNKTSRYTTGKLPVPSKLGAKGD